MMLGAGFVERATDLFRADVAIVKMDGTRLEFPAGTGGLAVTLPHLYQSPAASIAATSWKQGSTDACRLFNPQLKAKVDAGIYGFSLRPESAENETMVIAPALADVELPDGRPAFGAVSASRTDWAEHDNDMGSNQCFGDKICVWWDKQKGAWDDEGCKYKAPAAVGSTSSCECAQMDVDVMIISPWVECKDDVPIAVTAAFGILGLVFVGFLVLAGTKVCKCNSKTRAS
jgi:hypothetical protein